MTEQDTFNALKRISFEEMSGRIKERITSLRGQDVFPGTGWTEKEFFDEIMKREKAKWD